MNFKETIANLLDRANDGDLTAKEKLYRLVERELHQIANNFMRQQPDGHTLQATVLVNDAFLKLLGNTENVEWHDKKHFYGIAAKAMRHMLIDHERKRRAQKRGGEQVRVAIELDQIPKQQRMHDVIALDSAMKRLAELDPRQAEVIELHYFGGCTLDETAKVLEVSRTTVKNELRFAKSWLHKELAEVDDQ